jgi:YD repeat-containing protein
MPQPNLLPRILLNRTSNSLNQLTSVGGNALTYDDAGNLTQDDQDHVLVYDGWNRLIMVNDTAGHMIRGYLAHVPGERTSPTADAWTK